MRVLPPAPPKYDLPSLTDIKQAITKDPTRFFFVAGNEDNTINADTARQFLYERYKEYKRKGYCILDECFTPINYHQRWTWQGGPKAEAFWTAASVAFAEKAEGTVYVLLPPVVAAGSKWHFERPILMDSPLVENIILLDYDNNKMALKGMVPPVSPTEELTMQFQDMDLYS